ncbi:hypothetical protein SDC9_133071 [bioreactor metagenome]|uniref:Uncharacterized protein n=1 Tax=bioreactor metagenome TaxID=1076179 RepID=A0A645DA96_9ZZZZ
MYGVHSKPPARHHPPGYGRINAARQHQGASAACRNRQPARRFDSMSVNAGREVPDFAHYGDIGVVHIDFKVREGLEQCSAKLI